MKVSPALAQALADRRKTFNGRIAAARSRNPAFETDAFSQFLADTLDPLLAAVLAVRPDGGAAFVDAAFDMGIALVQSGWAGGQPRADLVRGLWRDVAPNLATIVATHPRETLGALTNATIKLSQEKAVRLQGWMQTMRAHGGKASSAAELRAMATVAAWRAGAAHLREAVLAIQMTPTLACLAVGADKTADWATLVAGYTAHRWWTPDGSAPPDGHRLGDFTGFGGRFGAPPRLGVLGDTFMLSSGEVHFVLDADAYGATLRPASREDGDAAVPAQPASLVHGDRLRADDRTVPCDWPQDGLYLAQTRDSIAVVSRFSHAARVIPRTLP